MDTRNDREDLIAAHDPANGPIEHVSPSWDNQTVAIRTDDGQGKMRLIFQDTVTESGMGACDLGFDMSPDGKKVATHRMMVARDPRATISHEILINGVVTYRVPFETIHYMNWIDSDRLAWHCWNRDDLHQETDKIHTFVNDVEQDDERFEFQPFGGDRNGVVVRENGVAYCIYDDGEKTEPVPCEDGRKGLDLMSTICPPRNYEDIQRESAQVVRPEKNGRRSRHCHVVYRGVEHQVGFPGIGNGGGSDFTYSDDKSKVGYVGFHQSWSAWIVEHVVFLGIFGTLEWMREAGFGEKPGAYRKTIRPLAWPSRILEFVFLPLAMVFGPYGPLGKLDERTRTYFLVDNGRVWKKGYRYAREQFYLPDDRLVALVSERNGDKVVIDQVEGPLFDRIENVRWNAAERCVCYLGSRGNEYYRVTTEPLPTPDVILSRDYRAADGGLVTEV